MTRWEYKREIWKRDNPVSDKREAILNQWGKEGWELVIYDTQSTLVMLLLKRPIQTIGKCAECNGDVEPDYLCEACRAG